MKPATTARAARWIIGLLLLNVVVMVACLMVGAERIDMGRALGWTPAGEGLNTDAWILFHVRLPRVLFAMIAGAVLSLAGAVYQALLRNDLADPYTLGVSGGASFGAVLVMNLLFPPLSFYILPPASFLFAGVAVVLIYTLARMRGPSTPPTTLLLAGITLNLLFAAGILLVQYLSDPSQTRTMVRWLMGGVDVESMRPVYIVGVFALVAGTPLLLRGSALNLISFGDRTALHLGVDVEREKRLILGTSSLMTAAVVAYAGPIGFVGLIVPHLMRRIIGPDHRLMLPVVVMAGAAFLVACDTVARTALAPIELPVGIITAFVGGPFFLWILFKRT